MHVCVGVYVHVCGLSSPYLLLPGHSADIHSKEPLVVIHGVTQPPENVTIRGKGETKRGKYTEKVESGVVLEPSKPPVTSEGCRYLFSYTSSFLQHHTQLQGKSDVCQRTYYINSCLNALLSVRGCVVQGSC